jgi:hypothetical protein
MILSISLRDFPTSRGSSESLFSGVSTRPGAKRVVKTSNILKKMLRAFQELGALFDLVLEL